MAESCKELNIPVIIEVKHVHGCMHGGRRGLGLPAGPDVLFTPKMLTGFNFQHCARNCLTKCDVLALHAGQAIPAGLFHPLPLAS